MAQTYVVWRIHAGVLLLLLDELEDVLEVGLLELGLQH